MSAFLVSKSTIDALVWARSICNRRYASIQIDTSDRDFGAMLLRANMRSLEERYGDVVDEAEVQAYAPALSSRIMSLPIVALIKLVHCFQYQACEVRDWDESEAKKVTDQIEGALVHMLPGYNEAAWGLPDVDEPKAVPIMSLVK